MEQVITTYKLPVFTIFVPHGDFPLHCKKYKNKNQNYQKNIIVNKPAAEVMEKIRHVDKWWIKAFSGSANHLNDKFRVDFSQPSFVDFVVSELIPDKKIVWKVADCYLQWFNDKHEWNNTEVVFEIAAENRQNTIHFTHIGLTPEAECFETCEKGWNGHIDILARYIDEGKGIAD